LHHPHGGRPGPHRQGAGARRGGAGDRGPEVRLGPGTLYTLLARFQNKGLIAETSVDGRKRTYRLTDKGRAAFEEELARLRACVNDGLEEQQ
ncbi:MAG: hypothetical protein HFF44_04365, partial [Lawsonibacter sp.]|nr:hypothetical protein [Lawsonibacter sp.]